MKRRKVLYLVVTIWFTFYLCTPKIGNASEYIPKPNPVQSEYLVGAYYYPGWKQIPEKFEKGWPSIYSYEERKPVLGWYQEGEPEVADWHIKWASEHGISFFAYDWYYEKGVTKLDHALHDGYLKSKYKNNLKYCLLWANHGQPMPANIAKEDMLNATQYWIDNYFSDPNYLRIDNKPVVIIFNPLKIRNDFEKNDVEIQKTIAAMKQMCIDSGYEGLYLMAG